MLKVKQGQLDALGLLFERYKKILFGFFYNMNLDQNLSEDLVQTVFERVLKYRTGFNGDGEFKVWMFHIARNVNIDNYRKSSRFKNEDIENHRDISDGVGSIEEAIGKGEELDILNAALNRLDHEKKEIITLSKIEGLKYKEIGKVLNCSEGAVKVKVFRAMQSLKGEFLKIQKTV
ncbi:MAG: RNA polymerase sigma factor [Bacteroidota bacterium]